MRDRRKLATLSKRLVFADEDEHEDVLRLSGIELIARCSPALTVLLAVVAIVMQAEWCPAKVARSSLVSSH